MNDMLKSNSAHLVSSFHENMFYFEVVANPKADWDVVVCSVSFAVPLYIKGITVPGSVKTQRLADAIKIFRGSCLEKEKGAVKNEIGICRAKIRTLETAISCVLEIVGKTSLDIGVLKGMLSDEVLKGQKLGGCEYLGNFLGDYEHQEGKKSSGCCEGCREEEEKPDVEEADTEEEEELDY
ncbi:hypothetical protein ISTM_441 [Insectomime virus]|uniref:Uncharacterized protein n=1 Tax=Tunisvirus fontaine2 TaxID=1421067 RepID=V9SDV5_9VIRU|nr:hypothetical protein D1R32_gp361 [Tunisvirus fontaine2]AHA46339.1 hypothetical protein ISTM_441 [Insectomime virus]AHC55078.1 hypothetical protein TNS_ORF360 [Tunisvirus fontaine2]